MHIKKGFSFYVVFNLMMILFKASAELEHKMLASHHFKALKRFAFINFKHLYPEPVVIYCYI